MNAHEPFADDLPVYALGALQGQERQAVEAHLQECSACRQELEKLNGDLVLLALSTSGPRPPARSRERLMAAIAKEPRRADVRSRVRAAWWNALGWAATAACIVIIVFLASQTSHLRWSLTVLESNALKQEQQLREAKQLLATLTSPDAVRFTLVGLKSPPQPQGKAIYLAGNGTLVFLASNMPELPPQKAYELWLIPTSGGPIPAGVFKPDAHGAATIVRPPLPVGVEAKTFAITIEPEAGSPAPTSTPIMVGNRG